MEILRLCIGGLFLFAGLLIFIIEVFGVFRFKYVLNRMHAAALGDTLGIGLSMIGLIVLCGFNFTSLKMFLVILFLWFSSPTASHLTARLELITDEEKEKHYQMVTIEDGKIVKKEEVKDDLSEENVSEEKEETKEDKA